MYMLIFKIATLKSFAQVIRLKKSQLYLQLVFNEYETCFIYHFDELSNLPLIGSRQNDRLGVENAFDSQK